MLTVDDTLLTRPEDGSMSSTQCPFCEHGNPADAKYCSECGGALHLAPCPHCGAVSLVTATVCYQCRRPLQGRKTGDAVDPDALDPDALHPDALNLDPPKLDAVDPDALDPDALTFGPPDLGALNPVALDPDAPNLDPPNPDALNPDAVSATGLDTVSPAAEASGPLSGRNLDDFVPISAVAEVFGPSSRRNTDTLDPAWPVAEVFRPSSRRNTGALDSASPAVGVFRLRSGLKTQALNPNAPNPVSPAAEVPMRSRRRPARAFVGMVILAAITVLGYYGYHQRPLADALQLPPVSSEATDRGASARAGVIRLNAAADDTKSARAGRAAGITSPATSPSGTRIPAPARAEANGPRAGRQPVESQKAQLNAAAVTRPQEARAGKADGQKVPRGGACTAAVVALGLCTPEFTQRTE